MQSCEGCRRSTASPHIDGQSPKTKFCEIVSQTIVNVSAGTNAQSNFAKADVHKAAGRYKDAFNYYRKAYKDAAK